MLWTKDETSEAPKTVYLAPAEAWPTVKVVYDPAAEYHWSVVYARLGAGVGENDPQADIEAVMGL